MVRTGFRVCLAALSLLSLVALPVAGQNILEQEQNAVAEIVRKTRGGIVSIEDAQGLFNNGPGRNGGREGYRELRRQASALYQKREEIETQIAVMSRSLTSRHPKMVEARHNAAGIQEQLDALLKASEDKADTRTLMERIVSEYLTSLRARRAQQEVELVQAKQGNAAKSPKTIATQQALDATNDRISAIQTELDGIRRTQQVHLFQIRQDTPKSGSGFSLGDGFIVTTADVLEGMKDPVVITDTGIRIKAEVVGLDGESNIGVLRLLAKTNLPALELGNSDMVAPGHFAISIGNQAGQPNSVALNMVAGVRSDGMYSGTHFYPSLIQIAGTIGVGSSGAPVLNARGEVVGVIAAIPVGDWSEMTMRPRGQSGNFPGQPPPPPAPAQGAAPPGSGGTPRSGFQGSPQGFFRPPVTSAGFVIPINAMQPVIADLRAARPVPHSWIGLNVDTIETWVINDNLIESSRTVFVNTLYPDSPAVRAGLQIGDIMVSMNGVPIYRSMDVRMAVMRLKPGDTLILQILHPIKDQKPVSKTLELKAASRPATFDKPLIRAPRQP